MHSRSAEAFYREQFARLENGGSTSIRATCTAEDLELSRKLQRMAGKPPRYAGNLPLLDIGRSARSAQARGLRPTLRFAVPVAAVIEFVDLVHGPQNVRLGGHWRFHRAPRRRHGGVLSFAMPWTMR